MRSLLQQPLIQFLLLGSIVFATDQYLLGNAYDPREIVIDDATYADIAGIFEDNQGRRPTEAEMTDLTIKWAQNEIFYREAQLMQLDRGDEMIRDRLVLKMRNVLFNRIVPPAPTEARLRAWFEANRDRYDTPERFDLEQFAVLEAEEDEAVPAEVSELAEALAGSSAPESRADDLRQYRNRSATDLKRVFRPNDVESLLAATNGRWVPLRSARQWHLARITGHHAAQPADFEALRTRIGEAFKAEITQAELQREIRAIAKRYDIRVALTENPDVIDTERLDEARLALGPRR